MQIPDLMKPFLADATKLLADGAVQEIEFSGGTYQVRVEDKSINNEVWAFIQLDEKGALKDCFCSCHEAEETPCCVHIAASYLRIFNGHQHPLHQRYERSLWNQLCSTYATRIGYKPNILKNLGKSHYAISSASGKNIFFIKGKRDGTEQLNDIIQHRHKETEETSLKFSNLSQEEILLWREGRPSDHLSYELSFWSDLAKWLMMMQENGVNYEVTFEYSPKRLPIFVHIKFPDVECGFYLSEANLPQFIPAIGTVESPLRVHNNDLEAVESITYDPKNNCFRVELKKDTPSKKRESAHQKGYKVGQWTFVEGQGFYPNTQTGVFQQSEIAEQEINETLTDHRETIKRFLVGTQVYDDPVKAAYSLSFDKQWNLHVSCYVFSTGDLNKENSYYFGEWVYLADDDGFFRLKNQQFDTAEITVPSDDVSEFVRQHRTWFNLQEGFQTYISSIEAQLTYSLTKDNKLSFARGLNLAKDTAETKDFGAWVYIAGQGFYSKVSTHVRLPVRPDISFGADQIPVFVRMNREELKLVPGFFSERCPVVKSGLIVSLKNDIVHIEPKYELLPGYADKNPRFFDDFVYVDGEGFHELPVDSRFPERFRRLVEIEPENQDLFLMYEFEKIKPFAISIDPRLLAPSKIDFKAKSITRADEIGKGWYHLKMGFVTERGTIPLADLWSAIKKKKRFLHAEEGMIDLLQKRFDWLRMLAKNRIDRRNNTLLLSTLELIRLNAYEEISVQKSKGPYYQESIDLLQELTEFRIPEEPELVGLTSQLRPYQHLGLRWLWFLYHHSLSGLLCDDMGLGKTHQAMALLAAVVNYHKKSVGDAPKHFLVICPTSVIYHWEEKLKAFLPGSRVLTFHGTNRDFTDFHKEHDILLTSYGIWRNATEMLAKTFFEVAILDEVQVAKNHQSRIFQSLMQINAQMRIGLTGTPIENHLRELKTLFDIVVPTYMPGETDYREFFVKPIEKEQNTERRDLLTRFVKPFMMRRKKNQVLLDLPEKIEEIAHCDLDSEQMVLYNAVIERSWQSVIREIEDEAQPVPYIHIFAILSSLKQICNHPAVFLKCPEKYKDYHSGKWDLFVELLSEARESQQKVVVFTQYLGMLDIFESYCNELGIGYATIRGSTINRGEQIHRFNNDPKCEIFLGSLQAAGLGLDLTAGSVVIHYDRWWNAARENQATDRVHRIGQKRGVQVFKLVTKNTFEEKIDQIIERKGRLMEDVVTTDDHQAVKKFTRDEITQLLQYVKPQG